jgi:hypothetical protein
MIKITTANQGNFAIQEERWEIPLAIAKQIVATCKKEYGPWHPGSYWHTNFAKPVNRASRSKSDTVVVYTSGFSTSEFARMVSNCGFDYDWA